MAIFFGHKQVNKPDGSTSDSWYGYRCGHCGHDVSGAVLAYNRESKTGEQLTLWLQCPICYKGSTRESNKSVSPGSPFGPAIEGLPADVAEAYDEARRCMSVNAHTAAEGICRKILMHVAVDKGADEGKSFVSYIDFLASEGYVTPPMREWVDLIKNHGNESTHRLKAPERARAEGTLLFTAQLLRSVYEMGHLASRFTPRAVPPAELKSRDEG